MSKILFVNKKTPDKEVIQKAINVIKSGGVIVYPTDTLYGLGANALDSSAILRVFKIKNRPLTQALPVIVSDLDMAKKLTFITQEAEQLMKIFWPGPLTIILEKKPIVPQIITGGKEGIGLRIPKHVLPLAISKISGLPLIATSANKHGGLSPVEISDVLYQFKEGIDLFIDGGKSEIGFGSTVIDLTRRPPMLLREGSITKENIESIIGSVENRR